MLSVTALIWGRGVGLSEEVIFPESCVHGTVYILLLYCWQTWGCLMECPLSGLLTGPQSWAFQFLLT